jgi:hypothetical protein
MSKSGFTPKGGVKKGFLGMAAAVLAFGLLFVGCSPEEEEDNTISSVSIYSRSGNEPPKAGWRLSTDVKKKGSDSDVSYQWKRADSQSGTFENISGATSGGYTPTIEDTGKYLRVEAKNKDTPKGVLSNIVGPVDANQVAKPTANIADGAVVLGQKITLSSTTKGYGVTIYYTLDGSTPTTDSHQYSSSQEPTITVSCTLKAFATNFDMVDSEVLSVSYTVVSASSFTAVTLSASTFDDYGISSVAYGNNRFVAGGSGGIGYSSNGTTWTDSTGYSSSFTARGITYGTQFIAVGSNGVINYSTDGTSWNNVTDTTFGTSTIYDVAYGGGKYVAVGDTGKMAYSDNGTSWTAVTVTTFDTSTISGITYGAGKFVAVGNSGKIAYSTNGTNWTAVTNSTFGTYGISGITYGGTSGKEKFVAVSGSFTSPSIAYSTDGETWTRSSGYFSLGSGLFSAFNRVAWGGNKYVAVAGEGVMYFSPDGINWAKIDGGYGTGKSQFDNAGSYSYINDIVYGGGKFLAVGIKANSLSGPYAGEMAISD